MRCEAPGEVRERDIMRKQIARAILVLIAVLGLSSPSWADVIQLGTLVYTQTEAESGIFSITNQTGDNKQDDFPVASFVSFEGMTLTVNGGLFGTLNADFNDSNLGHPGYEWDKIFQGLVASGGSVERLRLALQRPGRRRRHPGWPACVHRRLLPDRWVSRAGGWIRSGIIAVNARRVIDA